MRPNEGWRVAFLAGPALAFVILIVRRNLPESPRWLITHGREREAEEAMRRIEEAAISDGQHLEPVPESAAITILPEARYGYLTLLRVAFRQYPQRAVLGATLMITQSFLYNAIFFTYALVLTKFYHVSNDAVPDGQRDLPDRDQGRGAGRVLHHRPGDAQRPRLAGRDPSGPFGIPDGHRAAAAA